MSLAFARRFRERALSICITQGDDSRFGFPASPVRVPLGLPRSPQRCTLGGLHVDREERLVDEVGHVGDLLGGELQAVEAVTLFESDHRPLADRAGPDLVVHAHGKVLWIVVTELGPDRCAHRGVRLVQELHVAVTRGIGAQPGRLVLVGRGHRRAAVSPCTRHIADPRHSHGLLEWRKRPRVPPCFHEVEENKDVDSSPSHSNRGRAFFSTSSPTSEPYWR